MNVSDTQSTEAPTAGARDLEAIAAVVRQYFEGIHFSDAARIEQAFRPDARLTGHLDEAPYDKRRDEYMEILRQRPAPAAAGVPFQMEIRSIDQYGRAAVVRTLTPIGGVNYVDFLSLQKTEGRWRIVHKLFSHEPRPAAHG